MLARISQSSWTARSSTFFGSCHTMSQCYQRLHEVTQVHLRDSISHRQWEHVPVHIEGAASIPYKYINANLLTVVTQDRVGGAQVLVWLDPLTGNELHREPAPLRSVHRDDLATDIATRRIQDLYEANADRLFHYEVDREAQAVQGFASGQGKSGSSLVNLKHVLPFSNTVVKSIAFLEGPLLCKSLLQSVGMGVPTIAR